MLLTDEWDFIIDGIFRLIVFGIPEGIFTSIIIVILWIKLDPRVLCRTGGLTNYKECIDALIVPALVYAFTVGAAWLFLPGLLMLYIPAAAALFFSMAVMLDLNKAPGNSRMQILQLFTSLCIFIASRGIFEIFVLPLSLPSDSLSGGPVLQILSSMPLLGGGYAAAFCILASGGPFTNRVFMLIRKACRDTATAGLSIMLAGSLAMIIYCYVSKTSGFAMLDEVLYYNCLNPARASGGWGGMILMLVSVLGIITVTSNKDYN